MTYRRRDVVEQALAVLDSYGLADLTMRRLAAELGVQPSALYHHFANKQTLLAAVADEILARGRRPLPDGSWDQRAAAVCGQLRDAMLAYRDGADLVATVTDAGFPADLSRTAARTLLHYVFGHATDEQTHLQAGSAGAIDDGPRDASDFDLGLSLVLDGIRLRQPTDLHQPH
jgi:TetR/AcrR family tetracycline transcriptional repressor